MPYTLIISNTSQTNFKPVIVDPLPAANPESLIWTPGGSGLTLSGISGVIFPALPQDQVTPLNWYHGGNPPIPPNTIEVHSCESLTTTNSRPEVISSFISKGVFDLRNTEGPNLIQNISLSANAQIATLSNHNLIIGDTVEVSGSSLTIVLPGIYKVLSIIDPLNFTINYNSLTGGAIGTAFVNFHNYIWDEVYTTPVGLYNAKDVGVTNPDIFEFRMGTSNNSDELVIYIGDTNIIPKVNDSIIIQKFFQTEESFINASTTDGINNVINYSETETYEFKILAVSFLSNPLVSVIPYIEYTLTLNKSFAPMVNLITPEQYMFVLLNRKGTTVNRELLTDTWKLTQVYRSQLLGDPYNFVGITQPRGRKNFLYYKGAELLGVANLLEGVITPGDSPFVILDFADEIKDRIYNAIGEFEVHIPTIMIQGERPLAILTNSNPNNLASIVLTDNTGAGTYSALYLKYPNGIIRYGWVFYDLRIVVIDHSELATAMGYNANRNYTLAKPTLPIVGNLVTRSTSVNPILIIGASNSTTIVIKTLANHNLVTGDEVIISGVLGNTNANTPTLTTPYYVIVLTATTFQIYSNIALTNPVNTQVGENYTSGGLMYGRRLPFEYFYTYRVKGVHYNTMPYADVTPFNWQLNGSPNDSALATLDTQFNFLTHLADYDTLLNPTGIRKGFLANDYEIIIGKYIQSLVDPYKIDGFEDVVVMPVLSLKTLGIQNLPHNASFLKSAYDAVVLTAVFPAYNDPLDATPNNPAYNIFNVSTQLIYNLYANPIPQTLFTSEGEWTTGIIKYRSQAQQYRLTFEVTVPAAKWNGTQNPSFDPGDSLMNEKLITEIEFLIKDSTGTTIDSPYVYAKISPPIKKNNLADMVLSFSLDF